jgi:hypothetical protein
MLVTGIMALAGKILPSLFSTIDKAVTDKDLALELKTKLESQLVTHMSRELDAQRDIIVAEAKGGSWLQRSWRPITMLTFVFIVANNYILAPYAGALFGPEVLPILDLPEGLWSMIQIGLGGYVVGRSAEKVAKAWKEKG